MQTYQRIFYIVAALCLTGISLALLSCNIGKTPSEIRSQRAAQASGDIVIGIVDTSGPFSIRKGVQLAVEEMNRRGGITGRKLQVLWRDDEGLPDKGLAISQDLSKNPDIIAVIGHVFSGAATPASITYFENGVLFITPGATHPSLTSYGFWTTFRTTLAADTSGQQLAQFAAKQNFEKMVIIYNRSDANRKLAESFHERAVKSGIKVLATRSYFETDPDFRSMLAEIAEHEFDAVFLSGGLPVAATVIKQAREMGITTPFLGGDGLDSLQLLHIAGRAAENTIVPTLFSPQQPTKITQDFVDRFEDRYGVAPTTWDARGYDAVYLLETAIQKSGATVPITLSTTLHFLENWEGVSGFYSFTSRGDLRDRQLSFKIVKGGKFEFRFSADERATRIDPLKVVEDITIRIPLEHTLNTLDPSLSTTSASYEVIEQLFLGLVDLEQGTYTAIPELATSWTVSEDGLVYEFSLRSDVAWTDGTPVSAHDVVWTLQRNIQPETNSPNASRLYLLKNARAIHHGELTDVSQLGVRALDDSTVEFRLEYPTVYFPKLLDLPIYRPLPRHVIEAQPASWTSPEYIQTNGAYHLRVWEEDIVLILRKNSDYYDAQKVSIPEVRYYIISNPRVGLAMYKNNELDVLGSSYLPIPADEIPQIRSHPDLRRQYSQQQKACTNFLVLRPRGMLDNIFVRRAIANVIDRQLILDFILRGTGTPAGSLLPPGIAGPVSSLSAAGSLSPEHARLWLLKAGYAAEQETPVLSIACPSASPAREITQFLRETLEYELKLSTECVSEAEARRRPPQIELVRKCSDYPDASSFLEDFHPEHEEGLIRWNSKSSAEKFAELLERARANPVSQVRTRLYARAERILLQKETLVFPIYFEIAPSLVKPRVKGWHHNVLGGQYIQQWHFQE